MAHHVIQLMQMLNARLHFIVLLLAGHEMNAFRVELAQRLAKGIHLIVFATQSNHQHRPRIRVTHHVLQHGAGIDVIVAKLRAAVGVAEEENAVSSFGIKSLFQETVLDLPRNAVDTADGRQNPQLIAHADISVGTAVNLHIAIRRLYFRSLKIGLITVLIQIAEVSPGIVGMNMLTRRDVHQRMADRQTIFDDVLPLRNIA